MELLSRQKREPITEVKAHLVAKSTDRPRTGTILLAMADLLDMA